MSDQPAEAPVPPLTTKDPSPQTDEYTRSGKSGRFRFKSSRSEDRARRHRHDDDRRHASRHDRKQRHHEHGHEHRSSKRHKHHHHRHRHRSTRSPPLSPSGSHPSPPHPGLSADSAFRESLFDALGDDEGAAYWESVYGQPIHHYAVPSIPKGPGGELEQMDEEEYAAYVRTRMWARTREGMIEEQERARAERARQRRREERAEERGRFEREVEESLRRGEARRRGRVWRGVWEEYLRTWAEVDQLVAAGVEEKGNRLRNLLFWPVETGKRRDVSREGVEAFMRHAPPPPGVSEATDRAATDLLATLKSERVRWHPDKMQHRYGSLGIDEVVMRSVTEVFQIVDTMWNELKGKH